MRFSLSFECDNAAFRDRWAAWEIARVLDRISKKVVELELDTEESSGPLLDINGNRIGEWRYE